MWVNLFNCNYCQVYRSLRVKANKNLLWLFFMQTEERQINLGNKTLPKSAEQQRMMLGGIGAFAGGVLSALALMGLISYVLIQAKASESSPATSPIPKPIMANSVTALGRLEPNGEVVKITASSEGSRLAQLFVKQGDRVQAGQVIAVLDSNDRLQAALEQANRKVRIAQTKLAQVKAGAKTGEINAQKATVLRSQAQLAEDVRGKSAAVLRLEAEVSTAQTEFNRYEKLYRSGAVSASERDSKQLDFDSAQQQLSEARAVRDQAASTLDAEVKEAKSTLDSIAEVRPVDVDAAEAEVASTIVAVKQAEADLALASVKAPRRGQILKVHTWPGEVVGEDGIVEVGQTDRMFAVAEVYESDVKRLRIGQKAIVTSSAFTGKVIGKVKEIGIQIYKNNVLDTDPTAAADARIVEVKIELDPSSSLKVKAFTNLELMVSISTK
jgi:HlyD family secretion protein